MATKLVIPNVRGSYVFVNESNKDGKYGMKVLVPKKNKKLLKKIDAAIKEAAIKKFGKDVKMGKLKLPMRDPEVEEEDGKEYEGMMFFNSGAGDKKAPGIAIKRDGRSCPADQDDIDEYCYSGAFFMVSINFYGFDTDGNKGVAAWLNNIMIGKHGERIDGTIEASDEFEDYADDFDDEDDDDDFDDL